MQAVTQPNPIRPPKPLDRRLEEVAKGVGGGYCRLQMPWSLDGNAAQPQPPSPQPHAILRPHISSPTTLSPHNATTPQQPTQLSNSWLPVQVMVEFMMGYNVEFNKEDDLVFFEDAVLHLSRLTRVLRQPRGNALLVGVGGSGRQSLVRMAAFMADQKCFQIAVTRGYGMVEFRDDLKKALLDAGCDDKPMVFLMNDTQIAKEQFLEDINNVLNTGEVLGGGHVVWRGAGRDALEGPS